jgi:hypothetical protein
MHENRDAEEAGEAFTIPLGKPESILLSCSNIRAFEFQLSEQQTYHNIEDSMGALVFMVSVPAPGHTASLYSLINILRKL